MKKEPRKWRVVIYSDAEKVYIFQWLFVTARSRAEAIKKAAKWPTRPSHWCGVEIPEGFRLVASPASATSRNCFSQRNQQQEAA